jgi:hypothetical protein
VKGKGIRDTENNVHWHHVNRFGDEQLQQLLAGLDSY